MDECIHSMPIEYCALCRKPPEGVNTKVYVTKGGRHFHNSADCPALTAGWDAASERGQETHPIDIVHWQQALEKRDRCKTCVPRF